MNAVKRLSDIKIWNSLIRDKMTLQGKQIQVPLAPVHQLYKTVIANSHVDLH